MEIVNSEKGYNLLVEDDLIYLTVENGWIVNGTEADEICDRLMYNIFSNSEFSGKLLFDDLTWEEETEQWALRVEMGDGVDALSLLSQMDAEMKLIL